MTDSVTNPDPERASLEEVLEKLERAYESGEAIVIAHWVRRYPNYEAEIANFMEEHREDVTIREDSKRTSQEDPTVSHDLNSTAGPKVVQKLRGQQFGDYELLEEIARGGMGVVYKARQVSLDRTVAVKMILSGTLASDRDRQRFQTEAAAVAQLDHSHIVSIFEIGKQEDQHFFSMPFIDGESLGERLGRGPIDPMSAAKIVHSVAEAMQYAHEQGVIHRDLKPSNILMTHLGEPKVTDFGLAKRSEQDGPTTTGDLLGTPGYMAPEQASGNAGTIGPRADVYGLGAILYASLTGRPPFQAATIIETVTQVLESEPVAPRQLNRDVPVDLQVICLKALRKEPSRRFQSAADLAADLHRFIEGEPILARPVGTGERAWKWIQRRPGIAAMIVLVAIVGLLGISGIVYQWRAAEEARGRAEGLAESEGAARDLADERASQLAVAQQDLSDQLYESRLVRGDFLLERGEIVQAERLYLEEHEARGERDTSLSSWRLAELYSRFPRNGGLDQNLQYMAQGGGLICGTLENKLLVFDANGELIRTFESPIGFLSRPAISPSGRFIACGHQGSGDMLIWEVDGKADSAQTIKTDIAQEVSGALIQDVFSRVMLDEDERRFFHESQLTLFKTRPDLTFLDEQTLVSVTASFGVTYWNIESGRLVDQVALPTSSLAQHNKVVGIDREQGDVYVEIGIERGVLFATQEARSVVARIRRSTGRPEIHTLTMNEERLFETKYTESSVIESVFDVFDPPAADLPPQDAVVISPFATRVSEDGRYLISTLYEQEGERAFVIFVVDLETREVIARKEFKNSQVGQLKSINVSPSGDYLLVTAFDTHVLTLPNLEQSSVIRTIRKFTNFAAGIPEIVFPEDGASFLVGAFSVDGESQKIRRYPLVPEITRSEKLLPFPENSSFTQFESKLGPEDLAGMYEESGEQRVIVARGEIANETNFRASLVEMLSSGQRIGRMEFSPDGEMLYVVLTGLEARLVAMDSETMATKFTIDLFTESDSSRLGVSEFVITDDGQYGAVGLGNGQIAIIDLVDEEIDHRVLVQFEPLRQRLAFHPDGSKIAIIGRHSGRSWTELFESRSGELMIIDTSSGAIEKQVEYRLSSAIAFTADGQQIAIAPIGRNLIEFLDAESLELIDSWPLDSVVTSISSSPSERVVAAGTEQGAISFWDVDIGKPLVDIRVHDFGGAAYRPIREVRFSQNGDKIYYLMPDSKGFIDLKIPRGRLDQVLEVEAGS